MRLRNWLLPLSILAAAPVLSDPPPAFDPGKASFSVHVRGETIDYREFAVTMLPGVELNVSVARAGGATFEAEATGGALTKGGRHAWRWKAPQQAGLYPLTVRSAAGESIRLNVFVLVPRARIRNGELNGYTVGEYPAVPLKGLEIYKPPRGFIEITEENLDTRVSPHFTLRQFVCKQAGGYPKYLILRERLLLKLELLLQQVNEAGMRADSFFVMSGFRTPYYNHAIGNVKYSRHVYGGAADIFIDENPRDGVMDDLNKDGKIDVYDAGVLYDLIDRLYGTEMYEPYVGGLGRYKKTSSHGPFVHVDARGFRARWGD